MEKIDVISAPSIGGILKQEIFKIFQIFTTPAPFLTTLSIHFQSLSINLHFCFVNCKLTHEGWDCRDDCTELY